MDAGTLSSRGRKERNIVCSTYSPYLEDVYKRQNELSAVQNGGWDALSSDTQAAINRLKSVNTNWGDILFRDAFSQEYNLSLSGGTERVTYYTSFRCV